MQRIKSLLKTVGMELEFENLEIHFQKRKVSFLEVKTVKCKRGMSLKLARMLAFEVFHVCCEINTMV